MIRRNRKPGPNCLINPQIVKGCAEGERAKTDITEASRRFREITDLGELLNRHAWEHMGEDRPQGADSCTETEGTK